MPTVSILLSVCSLLVLVLGVSAWRLTSSRPLLINILVSSAFLLIGAYAATNQQRPDFVFMMPFFAAMLCTGRAIGFMWRSRKEPTLKTPALMMTGVAAICIIATIAAYLHQH